MNTRVASIAAAKHRFHSGGALREYSGLINFILLCISEVNDIGI
jgi:hypothetical protein